MKKLYLSTALILGLCVPAYAGGIDFGDRTYNNNKQEQAQGQAQKQHQRQGQGQEQSTRVNNQDTNIYNEKRQTGAIANSIACENGIGLGGAVPGGSGLLSACWTPKYKRDIQRDRHNLAVAEALAARTGKKGNTVYLTHVAQTIPEARETLEAVGIITKTTVATSTRGTVRATQRRNDSSPVKIGAPEK
jgi:hypothetical protein